MTRRWIWASISAAAAGGFIVGGLIGWFVRAGWTAEWVSAAGTWIGAAGTVAAIVWAVIAFRHERNQERKELAEAVAEQNAREQRTADQVLFVAELSGRSGPRTRPARVRIDNGTNRPIEIRSVELIVPEANHHSWMFRRSVIVESGGTWPNNLAMIGDHSVEMPEDHDHSRKFPLQKCALTFKVDGVEWRRTPDELPERIDP